MPVNSGWRPETWKGNFKHNHFNQTSPLELLPNRDCIKHSEIHYTIETRARTHFFFFSLAVLLWIHAFLPPPRASKSCLVMSEWFPFSNISLGSRSCDCWRRASGVFLFFFFSLLDTSQQIYDLWYLQSGIFTLDSAGHGSTKLHQRCKKNKTALYTSLWHCRVWLWVTATVIQAIDCGPVWILLL